MPAQLDSRFMVLEVPPVPPPTGFLPNPAPDDVFEQWGDAGHQFLQGYNTALTALSILGLSVTDDGTLPNTSNYTARTGERHVTGLVAGRRSGTYLVGSGLTSGDGAGALVPGSGASWLTSGDAFSLNGALPGGSATGSVKANSGNSTATLTGRGIPTGSTESRSGNCTATGAGASIFGSGNYVAGSGDILVIDGAIPLFTGGITTSRSGSGTARDSSAVATFGPTTGEYRAGSGDVLADGALAVSGNSGQALFGSGDALIAAGGAGGDTGPSAFQSGIAQDGSSGTSTFRSGNATGGSSGPTELSSGDSDQNSGNTEINTGENGTGFPRGEIRVASLETGAGAESAQVIHRAVYPQALSVPDSARWSFSENFAQLPLQLGAVAPAVPNPNFEVTDAAGTGTAAVAFVNNGISVSTAGTGAEMAVVQPRGSFASAVDFLDIGLLNPIVRYLVRPNSAVAANFRMEIGVRPGPKDFDNVTGADMFFIFWDPAVSANWQLVTRNTGVTTGPTDTGVVAGPDLLVSFFVSNIAGEVHMLLDTLQPVAETVHIIGAADNGKIYVGIKESAIAVKSFFLHKIDFIQDV